jgi:hypothetical protein
MKAEPKAISETHVARLLAAEDLRCGDYVSILQEIVEWPSFFWSDCGQTLPPGEPVQLACRPKDSGMPLKVKAICLPFVFVKQPCGQHRTLDVRRHRLARLTPDYAVQVWKAMRRPRAGLAQV